MITQNNNAVRLPDSTNKCSVSAALLKAFSKVAYFVNIAKYLWSQTKNVFNKSCTAIFCIKLKYYLEADIMMYYLFI
jgi:hypothetical protein